MDLGSRDATAVVGGSATGYPDAWTAPDDIDINRDRAEAQNLSDGIHS